MRRRLVVPALLLWAVHVHAQEDLFGPEKDSEQKPERHRAYVERNLFLGIGLGLEYGVVGGNLSYRPIPQLKVHAGGGYNFIEFAYNAGVGWRLIPQGRVCVALGGMYGANAAIVIQGLEQHNMTYYGLTFTSTVELHGKHTNNHWWFGLNIPFRSPEFWTDWGLIQDDPTIQAQQGPLPIAMTAGYNFGL